MTMKKKKKWPMLSIDGCAIAVANANTIGTRKKMVDVVVN